MRPYWPGRPSDHFDGLRFFNPGEPDTDRSLRDLLRWRLAGGKAPWPAHLPVTPARPEARVAGLRVTMVGHATLLVQAAGLNLLTDPVWSARASPVPFAGPRRITAPGIAWDDLPPVDAVLVSHNHYDHLDLPTLRRLHARDRPLIAVPLGNAGLIRRAVPGARVAEADWHEAVALGGGATTTLTRANHWSARTGRDRRLALWAGHFVRTPAGSIWFAGDTGYGTGRVFRDIRRRLGSPDVALVPIGAYQPRWFLAAQHADPADAVRIVEDVGAPAALGIHWGTFRLTDEAWDAPARALADARAAAGMAPGRLVAARPGEAFDY